VLGVPPPVASRLALYLKLTMNTHDLNSESESESESNIVNNEHSEWWTYIQISSLKK